MIDRVRRRLRLLERVVRRREHQRVDLLAHCRERLLCCMPLDDQPLRKVHERIALRIGLALRCRPIHHLVVRERVRVGTNHVRVHERGTLPLSRVVDRARHRRIRGDEVAAIHFLDEQSRERCEQLRDVAARRVHLHRHRDRVAVVLDHVHHRQGEIARARDRFPELALARRSLARGDVHDLVLREALRDAEQLRALRCLRYPHRLKELRPRRRRR